MLWIRPLKEITLADIDQVGGKAAHLGALLRAGFPVPEGFVINVDAFVAHFGEITDPLVKPSLPRLQAEFMAEVAQALLQYLGDADQVAVRSSSTEEDSSQASFAGQHSTYYFVTPNRIDQAIVDCWMSLWSSAALSYRRAGWSEVMSGEPVRMAVIVQRMIPAERSGVVFSRDPIDTDSSDAVIEASWGLGAALVDGRVSPDHARVTEDGVISAYVVNDKALQVSPDPRNHDAARLQEVAKELRHKAVLDASETRHLANISVQLETLFEGPQDVEWAFVGHQLYLLQSRPITTRTEHHGIKQKLVLFKPLAENFTEPLTPLSEDLYARVLPKVGAFYQGRCYLDLAQLQRLNIFDLSEAELVDVALLRRAPEQLQVSWGKAAMGAVILGIAYLADGANWIRTARATPAALQRYEKLIQSIRDNPDYTPLQAMRRLVWGNHPFEPIGHHMFYANISAGRYFLYLGALQALVQRFAPNYPLSELSRTYHGNQDMRSLALLNATDNLSLLLEEALAQDDEVSEQLQEVLNGSEHTLPVDTPFTAAYEEFLYRYGHRGPREMEMAAPSWREAPATLLNILHNHKGRRELASDRHGEHLAARDELHRHLKPWQRKLIDHLLAKISTFISLRENSRHYHIMLFDLVRQKILQIEQKLLQQGRLKVAGDVFFLRYQELEALWGGTFDAASAHELVRKRRREWSQLAKAPAQETINIQLPQIAPSETGLSGQCACPGQVEATARVVFSLSEAHKLGHGEILVAPYTDPAWTPLFTRAAGIIVGTGSFLSHAGTVARELQVPCVVDVKDCMQRITDGQRIRLDASNGAVEVLT